MSRFYKRQRRIFVLFTLALSGLIIASGKPIIVAYETSEIWFSDDPKNYVPPEELFDPYEIEVFGDEEVNLQRSGVANKNMTWPGGIVPYVLDKNYSSVQVDLFHEVFRQIEQSVGNSTHPCIQFVERTTETNYVDIQRVYGCHSIVGYTDTGPQVSAMIDGCVTRGLVTHEMMHSLGIYHEQDRYDRGDYITVNYSNIIDTGKRNFKFRNDSVIDLLGTTYDFSSVMHYASYSFAKIPLLPVLEPLDGYEDVWIGQRIGLSEMDVLHVQRLYGCPEDTSHRVSYFMSDQWLVFCNFFNDTCGLEGEGNGNNTVPWVRKTDAAPDGPLAGSSNGRDPYLYASKLTLSPEAQNQSLIEDTTIIASIKTPVFTTDPDVDGFCINLRLLQYGPKSFLSVYIEGPEVIRTKINSYNDVYPDHWAPATLTVNIPGGMACRVGFEATLTEGSVSIDDIVIYKGPCK